MTNTTITPILHSRKDKNNLHPIKVRITENRKSFYINVGWSIHKKDWSVSKQRVKTTNKDHQEINYEIDKLVKHHTGQIEKNGVVKKNKVMVFNYVEELIRRKEQENQYSTRKRYNTFLQHLKSFCQKETLYFYELNETFLHEFKSFLEKSVKPNNDNGRPSPNSVRNYMGVFNTIINKSIKERIYIGENPFIRYELPKKERGRIKTLKKDEIWLLDNLHHDSEGMTELMWNSLNIFLFCFWSNGIRISDCLELKYKDFEDGFFFKQMRKTKKIIKFPITEKNILRLIPYIDEIPQLYDWNNSKYISSNLDKGLIDGPFIGYGVKYGTHTREMNILGLWIDYQKNRIDLFTEMEELLPNFNRKRQQENEVDYYYDRQWTMTSRDYHNHFRKNLKGNGEFFFNKTLSSKEKLLIECFELFNDYCRDPKNKEKFVFPYLRGLEHDYSDKRWNKISSTTSLINKYLKKISTLYKTMNFSTHSSRHTFSSISKDMGIDIYDLKEWLGHTSVKTTEIYINSIDSTRLSKHTQKISNLLDENE